MVLLTVHMSTMAAGQWPAWESLQPDVTNTTLAQDALELQDAFIVLSSSFNNALNESSAIIYKVNKEDGAILGSLTLSTPDTYLFSSAMLRDPASGQIHVFGGFKSATDEWGIGHQVVDTNLAVLNSYHHVLNGFRRVFFDNIRLLSNGQVVLAGGATDQSSDWHHMLVCKVELTGILLATYSHARLFIPFARDVIEIAPDTVLVASISGVNEPDPSNPRGRYTRFDGDLIPYSEFQAVPYDGSSVGSSQGKTVWDAMRMVPLAGGNFICSGRTGLPGPERAAIHKLDPDGTPLAYFAPISGCDRDFPASLGSSAMTHDGDILFAKMAKMNFGLTSIWDPLDPNEAHIFKLDTMLNLQCNHVVNGSLDERYYWISRILSCSDGGYLLLGGMRDLAQLPSPIQGWIRKFTAMDCFTGTEEHQAMERAVVYPNPGRDAFTLLLNGPVIPGAALRLFDAHGRQVATRPLKHGQVTVETAQLATGMYLYRVEDAHGRPLHTGKWVKE